MLTSCSSSKSFINDYSKSVFEPIQFLKSKIEHSENSQLKVEIINSHNGRFQLNSKIVNDGKHILVTSNVIDISNQQSDTIMTFERNNFIDKLNYEMEVADQQLVIAGNYQTIIIEADSITKTYLTRKAFGMISLLKTGESNYKKNK